jgi:hypothetical protein
MYRYCGSQSFIGDLKLDKFGQSVEFDDAAAKNAILGGAAIVPATDPLWKEFTDEELRKFSNPLSHRQAPAVFLQKKKMALGAYHEIRSRLESGGPLIPPADPAPAAPSAPAK